MDDAPHLTAVVGPTASGKTGRAVDLARATDAEIISADSRQVYREMTLGTGKDLAEYAEVPYHLIDIADPGTRYDLHKFQNDAATAIAAIRARGKNVLVCGGSGLYVETLLSGIRMADVPANPPLRERLAGLELEQLKEILAGYRPLHNDTDTDSRRRAIRAIEIAEFYATHPDEARATDKRRAVRPPQTIIGIDIPRDARRNRIKERLHQRLQAGMIEEVRNLLNRGIAPDDLIYYGLEYRFLTEHILGMYDAGTMFERLYTAICQFAKRQMTWLRGMERRGFRIHWLPYDMPRSEFTETAVAIIRSDRT